MACSSKNYNVIFRSLNSHCFRSFFFIVCQTVRERERERERERDRSATNIHDLITRTVTMSRDAQDTHGFGICVKGGKDAGHGVYISRIEEGSLAERSGLRPGDTILEVNGTPFTTVSHEEALKVFIRINLFNVHTTFRESTLWHQFPFDRICISAFHHVYRSIHL